MNIYRPLRQRHSSKPWANAQGSPTYESGSSPNSIDQQAGFVSTETGLEYTVVEKRDTFEIVRDLVAVHCREHFGKYFTKLM